MTSYPAISGINYGYGLDSIASDPYWQKYWMQSQQIDSISNAQRQAQAASTIQNNPVFQASPQTSTLNATTGNTVNNVAEEKKSGSGITAALGIGATAIGAAWYLASRGKSAGATGLWNQIKAGFSSFGKSSAKEVSKFQARQLENGKWVISLPDKNRLFKGAEIKANKDALGLAVNENLKWTDDLAKLKGYHLEIKGADGALKRITVRNGEVASCFDFSKGLNKKASSFTDAYKNGTIDSALKTQIDDAILAINEKKPDKIPAGVNIKNIAYTQEFDGAQALFASNVDKETANGIKALKTNRYALESDDVWAQRSGELKDAIAGLTNTKKPSYDAWEVGEAIYNPTVKGWPSAAKISIKDNQINGVIENGVLQDLNSTRYKSLYNQYQAVFDDAFKYKADFKNVVWSRAA